MSIVQASPMMQLLESASTGVRAQGDTVLVFASGVEGCTAVTCLPVVSGASNTGVENGQVRACPPAWMRRTRPPLPFLLPPCSSSAALSLSSHPAGACADVRCCAQTTAAAGAAPAAASAQASCAHPAACAPTAPHRDESTPPPLPGASHTFGPGEDASAYVKRLQRRFRLAAYVKRLQRRFRLAARRAKYAAAAGSATGGAGPAEPRPPSPRARPGMPAGAAPRDGESPAGARARAWPAFCAASLEPGPGPGGDWIFQT